MDANHSPTERRKQIAGEMEKAIGVLADIILDLNQVVEDEDRGPDNNAIGLIIFDDGSGWIAEFSQSPDNEPFGNGAILHQFGPDKAKEWFIENISERSL